MLNSISSVSLIKLPRYVEENGELVVMENKKEVPFAVARTFVVRAPAGAIRGQHAHKACAQFMNCPIGSVEVLCDDGTETARYLLDRPELALLVPPGVWAQQTYQTPGSVLTVLCDRPYEVHDYIRDYDEFKAYRRACRSAEQHSEKR